MRFLLTIILTLFLFTSGQLAGAFEMCADPECASHMPDAHKDPVQKKSESASNHCTVACHHIVFMPQLHGFSARSVEDDSRIWAETHIPESIFSESLIEPPALA